MARAAENGPVGVGATATGLAVLLEVCEKAAEEIGSAISPAQLRALLIISQFGSMNLNQLGRALDSSASATSRLIDRMQAAGLLTRDRAAASRREIVLLPTESGQQLAVWIRGHRQHALNQVFGSMSSEGREALVRGLRELACLTGESA